MCARVWWSATRSASHLRGDGLADDLAAAVALHEPPGAVGEGRQDFYGGAHDSTPSASVMVRTVGQGVGSPQAEQVTTMAPINGE